MSADTRGPCFKRALVLFIAGRQQLYIASCEMNNNEAHRSANAPDNVHELQLLVEKLSTKNSDLERQVADHNVGATEMKRMFGSHPR